MQNNENKQAAINVQAISRYIWWTFCFFFFGCCEKWDWIVYKHIEPSEENLHHV